MLRRSATDSRSTRAATFSPSTSSRTRASRPGSSDAASNPARSGPYSDRRYCVDRYDDAARRFLGKPATALRWGTKIEHDGVMDLVTVDDAVAAFERFLADHPQVARR